MVGRRENNSTDVKLEMMDILPRVLLLIREVHRYPLTGQLRDAVKAGSSF